MSIKTTLSCLFFVIVFNPCFAQYLPVNKSGHTELAEVVLADSLSKTVLFTNELEWFRSLPKTEGRLTNFIKDSLGNSATANYEFMVYAQSGILRKISGSITYKILVETKDGKYRYAFTDFMFHYYAQNRNYQMVKTGKTKLLEDPTAPGWQKLWTENRKTAYSVVTHQIAELKTTIIQTSKPEDKPEEKKVDW